MKIINHLFLFLITISLFNCIKEKQKEQSQQKEKDNPEEGNIMLLMEGTKLELNLQGKKLETKIITQYQ